MAAIVQMRKTHDYARRPPLDCCWKIKNVFPIGIVLLALFAMAWFLLEKTLLESKISALVVTKSSAAFRLKSTK